MGEFSLFLIVSGLLFTHPQAGTVAAEAYYKQVGLERNIEEWTQKNTTKELRARVGEITFVSQTLVTRRIFFEWSF